MGVHCGLEGRTGHALWSRAPQMGAARVAGGFTVPPRSPAPLAPQQGRRCRKRGGRQSPGLAARCCGWRQWCRCCACRCRGSAMGQRSAWEHGAAGKRAGTGGRQAAAGGPVGIQRPRGSCSPRHSPHAACQPAHDLLHVGARGAALALAQHRRHVLLHRPAGGVVVEVIGHGIAQLQARAGRAFWNMRWRSGMPRKAAAGERRRRRGAGERQASPWCAAPCTLGTAASARRASGSTPP